MYSPKLVSSLSFCLWSLTMGSSSTELEIVWQAEGESSATGFIKLGELMGKGGFGSVYNTAIETKTNKIINVIMKIPKTFSHVVTKEVDISKQFSNVPGCVKTFATVACQDLIKVNLEMLNLKKETDEASAQEVTNCLQPQNRPRNKRTASTLFKKREKIMIDCKQFKQKSYCEKESYVIDRHRCCPRTCEGTVECLVLEQLGDDIWKTLEDNHLKTFSYPTILIYVLEQVTVLRDIHNMKLFHGDNLNMKNILTNPNKAKFEETSFLFYLIDYGEAGSLEEKTAERKDYLLSQDMSNLIESAKKLVERHGDKAMADEFEKLSLSLRRTGDHDIRRAEILKALSTALGLTETITEESLAGRKWSIWEANFQKSEGSDGRDPQSAVQRDDSVLYEKPSKPEEVSHRAHSREQIFLQPQ